ncbi:unnamed protein product [Rotaria sp. Silwood1]|nr:unnamed protein product [Rotaria sp. Silwood1]
MSLNKSTCLCTESVYGTRCENIKNQIDIEFDDDKIGMMPFVFIHFITAIENDDHQRTTILKKINFDQNIITVFITHSFHVLFIELTNRTYYLGVLREKFIESEHIQTRILSNYRCWSISELMNNTFLNYSFVHRAKYYRYLCRQQKQLICFYDNRYMCICDVTRFSNCFTFSHTLFYDCQGENVCENGGLCFQDNASCPILSICACPECYYGAKYMILKVLVASNDWLYGCVALERVITVINSVKFNQIKSKQMAKWIILCVFLLTIITHIHDPIHRRLINDSDGDEQRLWCLVRYSSSVNIFNIFITFFHFLIPFSINLISTITIIISIARSRSKVRPRTPFTQHLRQQLQQHKHHLFASCALILLSIPRLIISLIRGCMKSLRDPWLYIFGYLISFIPSMMTIIVFVLPVKKYKDEFTTVI